MHLSYMKEKKRVSFLVEQAFPSPQSCRCAFFPTKYLNLYWGRQETLQVTHSAPGVFLLPLLSPWGPACEHALFRREGNWWDWETSHQIYDVAVWWDGVVYLQDFSAAVFEMPWWDSTGISIKCTWQMSRTWNRTHCLALLCTSARPAWLCTRCTGTSSSVSSACGFAVVVLSVLHHSRWLN